MGSGRHAVILVLMVLLAIILPPAAVLIETGCSLAFVLNILLTILGWIPGCIHALLVVFEHPSIGL